MKTLKRLPAIPKDLLEAFKAEKCGIFVGAGASTGAGLPDWRGLLQALVNRLDSLPNKDPNLVRDARHLLKDSSKQLLLASILKDELGNEFTKYIEETFGNSDREPGPLHRQIVELPGRFLITTNYDCLLEKAYSEKHLGKKNLVPLTYRHPGDVASSLHRDRFFLLKAHGDAGLNPEHVVLTERDYRRLIYSEPGYQSLLQTLFTTFTIFFVGVSFTDIELNLVLSFVHSSFHGRTPLHFAIIPTDSPNASLIKAWRREYNIEVISVEAKDDFSQVVQFVKRLASELK